MRIDAKYGLDTGMALVDVYQDTDHESTLRHREVWAELRPLLAVKRIDVAAVADFFLYRRGVGQRGIVVVGRPVTPAAKAGRSRRCA